VRAAHSGAVSRPARAVGKFHASHQGRRDQAADGRSRAARATGSCSRREPECRGGERPAQPGPGNRPWIVRFSARLGEPARPRGKTRRQTRFPWTKLIPCRTHDACRPLHLIPWPDCLNLCHEQLTPWLVHFISSDVGAGSRAGYFKSCFVCTEEKSQQAMRTAQEAVQTAQGAVQTAQGAAQTAQEVMQTAQEVMQTAQEAVRTAQEAVRTAQDMKESAEGAERTAQGTFGKARIAPGKRQGGSRAGRIAIKGSHLSAGSHRLGSLRYAAEGGLEDFQTAFDERFEADVLFAILPA